MIEEEEMHTRSNRNGSQISLKHKKYMNIYDRGGRNAHQVQEKGLSNLS